MRLRSLRIKSTIIRFSARCFGSVASAAWPGVRPARAFGAKPMQLPVYGDMNSRAAGMAEDCLYLNVWTPARTGRVHRTRRRSQDQA